MCVWPSVLAGPTNWLISLPHGAGGGQAGGLWEERVGNLAIGCNSALLVLIKSDSCIMFIYMDVNDQKSPDTLSATATVACTCYEISCSF